MTQIQHVTEKEMTRRTGVKNALGYTYPEKDLILLKKGLTGKKKREVLEHEINHLKRGEEGPWIGAAIGAGASLLSAREGRKGAEAGAALSGKQAKRARSWYQPYRDLGAQGRSSLASFLGEQGYSAADPTMEEVTSGQGYKTRLGAIENSAAARGGLLSGNALRDIGEFGASEYDRERTRRQQQYQQELANLFGVTDIGMRATQGSLSGSAGPMAQQANYLSQAGQANPWGDIAGFAGQYQGRQDMNNFLKRAYPQPQQPWRRSEGVWG